MISELSDNFANIALILSNLCRFWVTFSSDFSTHPNRAPSMKVQNSVLIFKQFRANFWLKQLFLYSFFKNISLKIFARINFRAPDTNHQNFGTNFHAISRKSKSCAKMGENLSA